MGILFTILCEMRWKDILCYSVVSVHRIIGLEVEFLCVIVCNWTLIGIKGNTGSILARYLNSY